MMNGVLSPWVNRPRLGLIGNPENRRIRDFQDAVVALGRPRPPCLSYEEILTDADALARFDVDLLRIDSPGENEKVASALIALGGGPEGVRLEFGEINFLREYHRGYCKVLEWIEQRGIPCLNAPRDIRTMFDKWECHERFIERGVARPQANRLHESITLMIARMRAKRSGQLFLKPLHGSSASGVCALRWVRGRQQLIASFRFESKNGRWMMVNSLKVHTYTHHPFIITILTHVLRQGMISERWIPKLTLSGGAIDLRVLVIAGEARHWVIRESRHPMTNLHLGNRRGDEDELRECIGEEKLNAAFRLAEQAAACFPDSLYAGVDVLIDTRHRALVGEINAFGDLLPRLMHRGEDAYTAIAKACHAQSCAI